MEGEEDGVWERRLVRGYCGKEDSWEGCGRRRGGCFLARKRHFPLIWTESRHGPNKLITYFHGSRALRQPDRERSPKNII
jgi:hypothetical protein